MSVQASDYLSSVGIGSKVSDITKNTMDMYTAAGFSALILSISGNNPTLITLPNNRAQLVLSKDQIKAFQDFLDTQVLNFTKKKSGTLDIALGPALVPWMLKYAVPAVIVLFLAGWFSHAYFGGR